MFNLLKMDCLVFLRGVSENSIDLVLTDFPYYISKKTGFQRGGGAQYERIKTLSKLSAELNEFATPRKKP